MSGFLDLLREKGLLAPEQPQDFNYDAPPEPPPPPEAPGRGLLTDARTYQYQQPLPVQSMDDYSAGSPAADLKPRPLPAMTGPLTTETPSTKPRGFLSKFFGTSDSGTDFTDRLLAASMGLKGDFEGEGNYLKGVENQFHERGKETEAKAQQQILNSALMGAFDTDPKTGRKTYNKATFAANLQKAGYKGDMMSQMAGAKSLSDKYSTFKNERGGVEAWNPEDPSETPRELAPGKPYEEFDTKNHAYLMDDAPGAAAGAPGAAAPAPATAAPPVAPSAPAGSGAAYETAVNGREGSGKNPYSSAAGIGQFLGKVDASGRGKGTWFDVMRNDPQFAKDTAGLSDTQILQLRNDPDIANRAIASYAKANAPILAAARVSSDPASLGLAHGYGPGDAIKMLKADPNTPVESIIGQRAALINRVNGKNTGQVIGEFRRRFGSEPGVATAAAGVPAAATAPASPGSTDAERAAALGLPPAPAGKHWIIPAAPEAGEIPAALQGLTGPDLLRALPRSKALEVQAFAEGRLPMAGRSISSPKMQELIQLAGLYDPRFDQANPTTRSKARVDWTTGQGSKDRQSLNTSIRHAYSLNSTVDKLGNEEGFPLAHQYNQARYAYLASKEDPRFAQFEQDRLALASELTRTFRGASGAEADIIRQVNQLDPTMGPKKLHETVRAAMDLLVSRLEAVGDRYNQGMSRSEDAAHLLTPGNYTRLQELQTGAKGAHYPYAVLRSDQLPGDSEPLGGGGGRQAGGPPVRVNSIEEARALEPGTVFIGPDGKPRTRR